ncbi:DivIVA domain-containing protein [Bifidobacterium callitrichos]|uniref:DivIVA domain-containing protein n=1 Tax=Bifidobacterium callitrichos TaxID=762209 RepID=UPI00168A5BA5|nr:DivIVA domain-containing protein [Bifidobacterium callitrichos]
MAQQSEAGIPRAGKRKWGYDPDQVDEFLDKAHKLYESDDAQLTQQDIQNVSFELKRGGYVIAQVDAALARLERAVVDKQTTWEISKQGRVAWKARTEELYREIAGHADRGEGERFAPGRGKSPSYDRRQVDRLIDRIVDKCAAELGVDGAEKDPKLDVITPDYVADSVFTQRKGRKGYDERQVDYFLNSCVELLSRIESFDRISDYIAADGAADGSAASIGSQPRPRAVPMEAEASIASAAQPVASAANAASSAAQSATAIAGGQVAPLFSADARRRSTDGDDDTPHGYAPSVKADEAASFNALSQAEQSLFSASATASASTPSVPPAEPVASVASTPVAPLFPVASAAPATSATAPTASTASVVSVAPIAPIVSPVVPVTAAPVTSSPTFTPSFAPAASVTIPTAAPVTPSSTSAPASYTTPTAPIEMPPSFATPPSPSLTPSASPKPASPVPAQSDDKYTTSSLNALAQMAEASQEFPKVNGTSPFEPHMPSLDVPNTFTSMPAVTPSAPASAPSAPVASSATASPAPSSTSPSVSTSAAIPSFAPAAKPERGSTQPPQPPFSLLSANNHDLGIPDLSFPSINGNMSDDIQDTTKKEQ